MLDKSARQNRKLAIYKFTGRSGVLQCMEPCQWMRAWRSVYEVGYDVATFVRNGVYHRVEISRCVLCLQSAINWQDIANCVANIMRRCVVLMSQHTTDNQTHTHNILHTCYIPEPLSGTYSTEFQGVHYTIIPGSRLEIRQFLTVFPH